MLVSLVRDGAEPGKRPSGGVRGSFCILSPEIIPAIAGVETMEKRELLTYPIAARSSSGPTDVTDQEKSSANRGRSSAAGVVAGACVSGR